VAVQGPELAVLLHTLRC